MTATATFLHCFSLDSCHLLLRRPEFKSFASERISEFYVWEEHSNSRSGISFVPDTNNFSPGFKSTLLVGAVGTVLQAGLDIVLIPVLGQHHSGEIRNSVEP